MKKFAIILSGCGGSDGSECHEAVSLMIATKLAGANYMCFAINEDQKYVIQANNSVNKDESIKYEKRSMLVESSRLNHGRVYDLNKLSIEQFDALVLPGGRGIGINLSNFFVYNNGICKKNENYEVRTEIKKVIQAFYEQKKPIFAGCLAPILLNGSLKRIKIMTDVSCYTKDIIENHNNEYQICNVGEICIDEENKIVTAPFYMTPDAEVDDIYNESVKAVSEIIRLCNDN